MPNGKSKRRPRDGKRKRKKDRRVVELGLESGTGIEKKGCEAENNQKLVVSGEGGEAEGKEQDGDGKRGKRKSYSYMGMDMDTEDAESYPLLKEFGMLRKNTRRDGPATYHDALRSMDQTFKPTEILPLPDPLALVQLERYISKHEFTAKILSYQAYTTSQRRAFERDFYDYARALGLSRSQAQEMVVDARWFCGETDYDTNDSVLDAREIDDNRTLVSNESTLAPSATSAVSTLLKVNDHKLSNHMENQDTRSSTTSKRRTSSPHEHPTEKKRKSNLDEVPRIAEATEGGIGETGECDYSKPTDNNRSNDHPLTRMTNGTQVVMAVSDGGVCQPANDSKIETQGGASGDVTEFKDVKKEVKKAQKRKRYPSTSFVLGESNDPFVDSADHTAMEDKTVKLPGSIECHTQIAAEPNGGFVGKTKSTDKPKREKILRKRKTHNTSSSTLSVPVDVPANRAKSLSPEEDRHANASKSNDQAPKKILVERTVGGEVNVKTGKTRSKHKIRWYSNLEKLEKERTAFEKYQIVSASGLVYADTQAPYSFNSTTRLSATSKAGESLDKAKSDDLASRLKELENYRLLSPSDPLYLSPEAFELSKILMIHADEIVNGMSMRELTEKHHAAMEVIQEAPQANQMRPNDPTEEAKDNTKNPRAGSKKKPLGELSVNSRKPKRRKDKKKKLQENQVITAPDFQTPMIQ